MQKFIFFKATRFNKNWKKLLGYDVEYLKNKVADGTNSPNKNCYVKNREKNLFKEKQSSCFALQVKC